MAKGDEKKSQNIINQQGAASQQKIDQIWGDQNALAYGQQSPNNYSSQTTTQVRNPFGSYATVDPKQRTLGKAIGNSAYNFVETLNKTPSTSPFATQTATSTPSANGGYSGSGIPPRPATIEEAVAMANQIAYGGRPQNTVEYWTNNAEHGNMWEKDPEYTWRRMLGEFGGGKDVATGGPFAGQNSGGQSGNIGYQQGLQNAIGGYNEFAQTGGFSPQDLQDIRARALSPIRANYQLAQDELTRHKALSGYMPNYAPAAAKMAREQSYAMSDANVNTSAMLAEAIRSGRLAGLNGMSGLGLGLGQQRLSTAGLQNQLLGTLANAQLGKSQIPSDFNQGLATAGGIAGIGTSILDAFTGNNGSPSLGSPNTGSGSAGQTSGVFNPSGVNIPFGGEGPNLAGGGGIPGISNFGNPFGGGTTAPVFSSSNTNPNAWGAPIPVNGGQIVFGPYGGTFVPYA